MPKLKKKLLFCRLSVNVPILTCTAGQSQLRPQVPWIYMKETDLCCSSMITRNDSTAAAIWNWDPALPGEDISPADALSSKPLKDCDNSLSEGMDEQVLAVMSSLASERQNICGDKNSGCRRSTTHSLVRMTGGQEEMLFNPSGLLKLKRWNHNVMANYLKERKS